MSEFKDSGVWGSQSRKGIPQGLKPLSSVPAMRPEPKRLGVPRSEPRVREANLGVPGSEPRGTGKRTLLGTVGGSSVFSRATTRDTPPFHDETVKGWATQS